ncbi:MAG: helix-turn-helix domain-containing protein [Nitrospiraceae bacterium]
MQTVRPSVEQVLRRVAQAYGLPVKDVRTGRRGQEGEARKVATYLVKRCCDLTLQETATRLGVGSYGTIAWACHQVRARRAADRRLRRQVERLEHELNQPKT